jgi:hypothetical protein
MTQNPPPPPQLAGPPPESQNGPTPESQNGPAQPEPEPGLPARPAVVPMLPTRLREPGRRAPLPDVVAVRRLAVPDPAPPYDDEVATGDDVPYAGNEVFAEPVHAGPAAVEQAGHEPGASPAGSRPAQPPDDSPRPDHSPRPDPATGWPSQFAQVLAETLAGSRPAQQLTPWTTEQARRRIRQLGPMLASDQRPRVRRVITSAPAAGVLEMTAVVGFGPRVRALALRLEDQQTSLEHEQTRPYRPGSSHWCCTAVESA